MLVVNPLRDLVATLETYTGAEDPVSFAPALEAVGRDRAFISDWLRTETGKSTWQRSNTYREAEVLILADAPRFQVRLTAWPAEPQAALYRDRCAHTHAFDLLAYGFAGPGCMTTRVDVDPDDLERTPVGEVVAWSGLRTVTLTSGRLLYYPAFRVAHVQHPPMAYSISLTVLLLRPQGRDRYQPHHLDLETGVKTS